MNIYSHPFDRRTYKTSIGKKQKYKVDFVKSPYLFVKAKSIGQAFGRLAKRALDLCDNRKNEKDDTPMWIDKGKIVRED